MQDSEFDITHKTIVVPEMIKQEIEESKKISRIEKIKFNLKAGLWYIFIFNRVSLFKSIYKKLIDKENWINIKKALVNRNVLILSIFMIMSFLFFKKPTINIIIFGFISILVVFLSELKGGTYIEEYRKMRYRKLKKKYSAEKE